MAPKGMKVVVQKKGKTNVAPKKSAASSMTALTEWAKDNSDDDMGSGPDDDIAMKKPSGQVDDSKRRHRNKDYHFQKQLSSMPKAVVEVWRSGSTAERTAMVNILMEEKGRGNYVANFRISRTNHPF